MTLEHVLRLHALGLSLIPLKAGTKKPDTSVLPIDDNGDPVWTPYQTVRATETELRAWFGNGAQRNVGIVVGRVSNLVCVETDTPEAEALVGSLLPHTPMMTQSARGRHRYYRLPTGQWVSVPIPANLRIGGITIEVKREGQYLVGPGSVHPGKPESGISPGHVYAEVEPWPASLDAVPEYPMAGFRSSVPLRATTAAEPMPGEIKSGSRNNTLFKEGCRLRRLGWSETEIVKSLQVLNAERCSPPVDNREVETIARSCARYEPTADTCPLTEVGDAEFFAACNADIVRYDHRRGRFLLYEDHRWAPQADGGIYRLALESTRARQAAALKLTDDARRAAHIKWAVGGEARKRQSNLLALAQNLKPIADAGNEWDTDPWLLGVPNGVVDLRTGLLRDGRPDDRITMNTNVGLDPHATCPLWDSTVAEIFDHDADLISYFDRYVGYSLTGDCREETLAFCWGDGANGKGTLMNTIGWVLGDYADDLPFSALELHDRNGIPNDIAKIVGKRFVTSSETGETQRLNEARVKALTGRDPITARFLHREFFTFQPMAKFWLATNQKPEVRDTSVGFWRRMHLIPFTQSFADKADLQLKDKLRAEAPGVLARAVRGCLAWQRQGLDPPEVVREATDSYRTESLPLTRFLDEACVVKEGARATFGNLFDSYRRWCGTSRERRLTRKEFNDALRERFKVDPNERRNVTFVGVGLVTLVQEDDGPGAM